MTVERYEAPDSLDELVGGVFGMGVPIVGSVVQGPMSRLSAKVRQEWRRRGSLAMRCASEAAGMSPEDLAEHMSERPEMFPLVTRVVFAAGMSGNDATLEALGAALGSAVLGGSDRVDEVDLLLEGIARLRGPHIRMLRVMAGEPDPWPEGSPEVEELLASDQEPQVTDAWRVESLAVRSTVSPDIARLLLTTLINSGFVRASERLGGTGYQITSIGLLLLDSLDLLERARRRSDG